MKLTWR